LKITTFGRSALDTAIKMKKIKGTAEAMVALVAGHILTA